MSDLTATNCGCNDSCGCASAQNNNGFSGCTWIILLLLFCGGNNGIGLFNNNGCGCNNGNNSCEWIIWILLLSSFCGCNNGIGLFNNNGCGCNSGCGC